MKKKDKIWIPVFTGMTQEMNTYRINKAEIAAAISSPRNDKTGFPGSFDSAQNRSFDELKIPRIWIVR